MKQLTLIISLISMISCAPGGSGKSDAAMESDAAEMKEVSALAVEVKEMIPETISRYFEVTGYMEALQDAYISPEINGQIKFVKSDRGDRVQKGETLIQLNTDLTEKSIAEVRTSLELATVIFEKQEGLWKQNIGSELQFLEAKNGVESLEARLATLLKQLDMARVSAPFAGIVDDIMVKEGEMASPGMMLVHLINLNTMRVSARVSEAYLNSVRVGDQVELRFSSYPEDVLKVRVSRLGEMIDNQTRTFTLEVILKNSDEKYKPNMLTSVRITDYKDDEALVVPSIVLKQDFNGMFLFRAIKSDQGTTAEKVYVKTGITVEDKTVISEGISPEDRVIIKGYNLVSDGSQVSISNI